MEAPVGSDDVCMMKKVPVCVQYPVCLRCFDGT